jgi:hypothetical protein
MMMMMMDESCSTSGVQTITDPHHSFLQSANYSAYTQSHNLIPGMSVLCRWGVESGRLMYPIMFGHVPTCVYMSRRPSESFICKQQRKQYMSVV